MHTRHRYLFCALLLALTPVLAVAATLALAIMAPTVLRNLDGAEGPRSITVAGPVAAVRFGEEPDATVVLEAGCFDLAAGSCR